MPQVIEMTSLFANEAKAQENRFPGAWVIRRSPNKEVGTGRSLELSANVQVPAVGKAGFGGHQVKPGLWAYIRRTGTDSLKELQGGEAAWHCWGQLARLI